MNKGKIIAISGGTAVAIAIAVVAGTLSMTPESGSQSNPRVVFWRHVHGLGIDPVDSNILYIATHGDFYRSINGGPPEKVDKQRADYMAFTAPQSEQAPLYASGHPSTGGNMGLAKSTDGGQTWQLVSTVLDSPVDFHAMAVSSSNPDIIIGFDSGGRGLFETTDAGKTWEILDYPEYILSLAIDPDSSDTVFAGTTSGIFRSSDGSISWVQINDYQGLQVYALAFGYDGSLYASVDTFGLVRSSDQGVAWEKIDRPDLTVTSIAVDSGNSIYIAGFSTGGFQEVYKGSLDGSDWQLIGTNEEL